MKVFGIDLAGRESNPSGFASLSGRRFETKLVYSDDEIIETCARERPSVVAIDAPFSLPKRGNLREADSLLIKRGYRVFPPTFAGMRSLTERGMRLAEELGAKKIKVIEIHPRTSGLLLFKTPTRERWVTELKKRGWQLVGELGKHEIDAILAALTGALFLGKKTEAVGAAGEGVIIVPLGRLCFPGLLRIEVPDRENVFTTPLAKPACLFPLRFIAVPITASAGPQNLQVWEVLL